MWGPSDRIIVVFLEGLKHIVVCSAIYNKPNPARPHNRAPARPRGGGGGWDGEVTVFALVIKSNVAWMKTKENRLNKYNN